MSAEAGWPRETVMRERIAEMLLQLDAVRAIAAEMEREVDAEWPHNLSSGRVLGFARQLREAVGDE